MHVVEQMAGFPQSGLTAPIPGCTYCQPQVASVGLTEAKAKEAGHEVRVGRFPFIGNGKAIALGEPDGLIKTVFDAKTGQLLGAHMVGAEVTELIQGYVVGRTLETMMGSRRVTTFIEDGREYDVVVQGERDKRMTPADLGNTQVRGRNGTLVPLSNMVSLEEIAEPGRYNRFNRLRAITITAELAPGTTMGEAINRWDISRTKSEAVQEFFKAAPGGARLWPRRAARARLRRSPLLRTGVRCVPSSSRSAAPPAGPTPSPTRSTSARW